jgi:hypothetical protein
MRPPPKDHDGIKRAINAVKRMGSNNPKPQKYSQEHARWKKILEEVCPTYEQALNLLAWTFVSNTEIEKELSSLSEKYSEVISATQLLSNTSLPKKITLKILKDPHENDAIKIAKLAIKTRTTSTAKSGGDKKAENAKKIEDFAKEKYLLNKELYELKSASAVATLMVDTYGVRAVGEFNTLRQKIPVWKLEL